MFNTEFFRVPMIATIVMGVFALLVVVGVVCIFIFVLRMMFDPKARAKITRHQLKMQKQIIDENEDILKDISAKSAGISSPGYEITARAVKKGLTEEEDIYCKHCGKNIDADSKFCNKCGKEQ